MDPEYILHFDIHKYTLPSKLKTFIAVWLPVRDTFSRRNILYIWLSFPLFTFVCNWIIPPFLFFFPNYLYILKHIYCKLPVQYFHLFSSDENVNLILYLYCNDSVLLQRASKHPLIKREWSKTKLVRKKIPQSGDSSAFFHFYFSSLHWLCVLLYKEGWW